MENIYKDVADSLVKNIEKILDEYANDFGEDSYNEYRGENDEYNLEMELEEFLSSQNILYDFTVVGGFDSPGFSISCNCLTVYLNGMLYSYPINYISC